MKKLAIGNSSPQLNAVDLAGKTISFEKVTSPYVLLAFLRYSECPWCNLALHRLAMEKKLLHDSNCEIIAFIQSTPSDIKKSIIDKHAVTPDFTIIADPEMKIYHQFGINISLLSGLKHHLRHIPAWVESVRKERFTQKSINGDFFLAPAAILVSTADNKVISADYNADFYEHESFSTIYETIAEHQLYGASSKD